MSEKRTIKGTASVTVEVPFEVEIDMDEFYEWSEDDALTEDYARHYLDADRNYPDSLNLPSVGYPVQEVEIYRVHVP